MMLLGAVSGLVWQVIVLRALHSVLQQRIQSYHLHRIQRQLQTWSVLWAFCINCCNSLANVYFVRLLSKWARRDLIRLMLVGLAAWRNTEMQNLTLSNSGFLSFFMQPGQPALV